jgi:hypothetical protein
MAPVAIGGINQAGRGVVARGGSMNLATVVRRHSVNDRRAAAGVA